MLPPIDNLLSAEMIRDGGSLAARFHCTDGAEYVLFLLLIRNVDTGERQGYAQPQIRNLAFGTNLTISWQHALALVHQLQSLSPASNDRWLLAIEESIRNNGALPVSVSRFIGVSSA